MKHLLILCSVLLLGISLHAQGYCTGHAELYRNRHRIDGMTYGHPYTTFDRKNGLSFEHA